jgi:hypothetical protein
MYVQHVHRPDTRKLLRAAWFGSVMVLVLWGALAVIAWATTLGRDSAASTRAGVRAQAFVILPPVAAPAGSAAVAVSTASPALPSSVAPAAATPVAGGPQAPVPNETVSAPAVAGRYVDTTQGFAFSYPDQWIPNPLAPSDAPGSILGLPATPVPGSVGGVEFPYSSHIDLSVIVQDTRATGAGAWGATPAEIVAKMAASQGLAAAVSNGTAVHQTTASGVEVWGLKYAPANATQRMWVVAPAGRYNYLFFLTVGGAADDRGTVQQMFDEVVPSFSVS